MTKALLVGLLTAGLLATACSEDAPRPGEDAEAGRTQPEVAVTPEQQATDDPAPVVGHGRVEIDGEVFDVSGDCDVSRDFGTVPVDDLDDPAVDIVLVVDNIDDGSGTHAGPWPFSIELVAVGGTGSRVVDGRGGADGEVAWSGQAAVLELLDRRPADGAEVAILHVEVERDVGSSTSHTVVVDVACRVNGPR